MPVRPGKGQSAATKAAARGPVARGAHAHPPWRAREIPVGPGPAGGIGAGRAVRAPQRRGRNRPPGRAGPAVACHACALSSAFARKVVARFLGLRQTECGGRHAFDAVRLQQFGDFSRTLPALWLAMTSRPACRTAGSRLEQARGAALPRAGRSRPPPGRAGRPARSRGNAVFSAVACTSTSAPEPVSTKFASAIRRTVFGIVEVEHRLAPARARRKRRRPSRPAPVFSPRRSAAGAGRRARAPHSRR